MKPLSSIRCAHGAGPGEPCLGCAISRYREAPSPRGKYDMFAAHLKQGGQVPHRLPPFVVKLLYGPRLPEPVYSADLQRPLGAYECKHEIPAEPTVTCTAGDYRWTPGDEKKIAAAIGEAIREKTIGEAVRVACDLALKRYGQP